MAEVFKAKSYGVEGFEKVIAIKRILPSMGEDRDFIKMFIDEAKIAGQLAHANICQIFELGRIEGAHFIAMEYIWGKDLLQIQNRFRKLRQIMPVPMACHVVAKSCEGLDYSHRKKDTMGRPLNIVHRDCSPQNVLISFEGEVKVIDFGIAKASSRASRTMAGVLKGKFGYMSPEQVRGLPLDRRADIFALGTVLYESLTGERLFQGESDFSTLEKVRNVDIIPPAHLNRNIPPAVDRIVMKSLAKETGDRYQWCSEMRADLQQYLMTQPEVFTAKRLSGWVKNAFATELAHERALMESYKGMGRDGLIMGKPQAEIELDVVQYLGEAGEAEDPTILGAPDFDDVVHDTPRPQLRRSTNQAGSDFGDEAPTELFGEIGDDEEDKRPTHDQLPKVESWQAPSRRRRPATSPAVVVQSPSQSGYAAAAMQQADSAAAVSATPMFPLTDSAVRPPNIADSVPGLMPGAGLTPPPMTPFGGELAFGSTSSVTPLPIPAPGLELPPPRRRRPSIVKDVAIGVTIAVVVLGLFVGGKYLFFGDKPGTGEASASGLGTIAVVIPGSESADVFVDDEPVGSVKGGEALTLDPRPAGTYTVRIARSGDKNCEKKVEVKADQPSYVTCDFVAKPATGRLVLKGITDEHTVLVDGQQISSEAAREPLKLTPGIAHDIVVKRGDDVVKTMAPRVEIGQKLFRDISPPPTHVAVAVAVVAPVPPPVPVAKQPVEKQPVVKKPVEKKPVVKKPVVKKPVEKKPVEKKPVEKKPVEKKPIEKKPVATAAATGVGYLIANSKPWGARVWVDGKDTKMSTPIAKRRKIALKPGKHKVTFVLDKKKYRYSVVIESGKVASLKPELPVK